MDNNNIKKLLCYNIVNGSKCLYKDKCVFAHSLEEQKKETIRSYIIELIHDTEDLSDINLLENKILFDELIIFTKECKHCINKKCPGGFNCRHGVCLKANKICYNDLMYGKCYNIIKEDKDNNTCKCIHGMHLTEKGLIPYHQRLIVDINYQNYNIQNSNINLNIKNNIIFSELNDNTLPVIKEIISNKINKNDIIKNVKSHNNNIFNYIDNIEDNNEIQINNY